jgi:predicted neutral ceramidase superfamily lipid hydrolase
MYSFISLAFLLTEDWRTTYVLLDANNIKRRA